MKIDKVTGRWIEAPVVAMKPPTKRRKTKKKGPTPKTYVVMIMDKSGSMWSCKDKARNHFNEQVQEIKASAEGQDVRVSLVMFNRYLEYRYFNAELESLRELQIRDYTTHGGTALNDAIGCTIDKMKLEHADLGEDHVSVLFVIVTDGMENSSRTYPKHRQADLKARMASLQESGRWTFTYMGTEHDVEYAARSYSIPAANVMRFEKKEMARATRARAGTRAHRTRGSVARTPATSAPR